MNQSAQARTQIQDPELGTNQTLFYAQDLAKLS